MDEGNNDVDTGVVDIPCLELTTTKYDEIRRHYKEIGNRYRPWSRQETQHIFDYMEDDAVMDFREIQEQLRTGDYCGGRSARRHRSMVEIRDHFLILVLLVTIEVGDPVNFLHARFLHSGRDGSSFWRSQAFHNSSRVWRRASMKYLCYFPAYHGMTCTLPTTEALRAARHVTMDATLRVQEYLLFQWALNREGCDEFGDIGEFSYTYEGIRRDLDYSATIVGWVRSRHPFDLQHRTHYLSNRSDPDMTSFPVNFYRVLRLAGGANRAEVLGRHYGWGRTIGFSSCRPFSVDETAICMDEILSYGGTNILRIQQTMRDSPRSDVYDRSIVEIHDRCLLLLALRAVCFQAPVLFLHDNAHECLRLSLNRFLIHCCAYREYFAALNGYPWNSVAIPLTVYRASCHAPNVAFRIFRDYNRFYSSSFQEMQEGIITGQRDFPYHYCDLQHLALVLL
jgi:hypothetical protein